MNEIQTRPGPVAPAPRRCAGLALLLGFMLFLGGCGGVRDSSSELKAYLATRTPVVIMHGGFATCGLVQGGSGAWDPSVAPFYQNFLKFKDELAVLYNKLPRYLVGCYTEFKFRTSGKGRYFSSFNMDSYRRATTEEAIATIDALMVGRDVDLYIVGQSFGGWFAMRVAERFADRSTIRLLATIDPISQVNCNPFVYLGTYIWSQTGCQERPMDFTTERLARIRKGARSWLNFYQTEYTRIHSGPFAEATENILRHYGRTDHGAHAYMSHDRVIWQTISERVRAGLQEDAARNPDEPNI